MVYDIIYKCRLCGCVIIQSQGNEDSSRTGIHFAVIGQTRPVAGISVTLTTYHTCDDGSFGVCDLQGAKLRQGGG